MTAVKQRTETCVKILKPRWNKYFQGDYIKKVFYVSGQRKDDIYVISIEFLLYATFSQSHSWYLLNLSTLIACNNNDTY